MVDPYTYQTPMRRAFAAAATEIAAVLVVGALVVVVGTAMLVSADLATPVTTPRAEVQENNWPEFGSALRAAATMTEAAVGVTAACVTVTVKAPVRDGATKRYS